MAEAKKKVEATKPTPEEKQAAAEAEVDALVARAKKALDEFENLDQKQVIRLARTDATRFICSETLIPISAWTKRATLA